MDVKDLWHVFDVGEEHEFEGILTFANELARTKISFELIVFVEPTDLRIEDSHRGCYEIHVTAHGKSAHAGHQEGAMTLPFYMMY